MKQFLILLSVAVLIAAFPHMVNAEVVMYDWCVNLNGDINTACNGAGAGGGAINMSGFDTTLVSSGPNSLGQIVVTLGPGSGQYVLAYMDYDLNYAAAGSFQDYGTVVGTPGSGISYFLDDPNSASVFNLFAANTLPNGNNVSTGTPNVCCDVSWALGVNLDVTQSATITFHVADTAPSSGFYLQETNLLDGESIYFTAAVRQEGGPLPGVPEPSMFGVVLAGGALLAWKRFRAGQ